MFFELPESFGWKAKDISVEGRAGQLIYFCEEKLIYVYNTVVTCPFCEFTV